MRVVAALLSLALILSPPAVRAADPVDRFDQLLAIRVNFPHLESAFPQQLGEHGTCGAERGR